MESETKIIIIFLIALVVYSIYNKGNQHYTIPPQYKGQAGLAYVKKNYASELVQAKSLCLNQFKGNWIENSNNLGCYNMQGFSSYYCNLNIIRNLINLCKSIKGTPICSSNQASCTV